MLPEIYSAFEFDRDTHTFTVNGVVRRSVTFVLASAGICDFSFVDEEKRARALRRGKSVHWMLELEDQYALNYRKVPRPLRGYRKGYMEWKKRSGFLPALIEKKFVSEFGYAGIIDRTGTFPPTDMHPVGSQAVLDLKTGEIADWVRFQLAAYVVGIEPRLSVARTIRRIALALRPDATYAVREFPASSFESDFARFFSALKSLGGV